MYVNTLEWYCQGTQTTWAERNNNPKLRMLFESHEAVRWNRALWMYFAWIEMADVWPAGLFWFFLPFPSLLLGFPWELLCLWTAPQLPAASLKLPLLIAQPRLACHVTLTSREQALQHPSPWVQHLHLVSTFNFLTWQYNLHPSLSLPPFPVSMSS